MLINYSCNSTSISVSKERKIALKKVEKNQPTVTIELSHATITYPLLTLKKTVIKEFKSIKNKDTYKYKKFNNLIKTLNLNVKNIYFSYKDQQSMNYSAVFDLSVKILTKRKAIVFNNKTKKFETSIIYRVIRGPFNTKSIIFSFSSDNEIFYQKDIQL